MGHHVEFYDDITWKWLLPICWKTLSAHVLTCLCSWRMIFHIVTPAVTQTVCRMCVCVCSSISLSHCYYYKNCLSVSPYSQRDFLYCLLFSIVEPGLLPSLRQRKPELPFLLPVAHSLFQFHLATYYIHEGHLSFLILPRKCCTMENKHSASSLGKKFKTELMTDYV